MREMMRFALGYKRGDMLKYHPAGTPAHERLTRLRLGEVELLHLQRCAELLQDGRADPHAPIL